jgi:uncharacterized phage-associated protein
MKALTSLKTSVFNWESSYFGGYERVVYDHPFVYVPREIEFRYKNTTGASIYVADKLCAMFLHRVIKHDMLKSLLHNHTVSKVTGWFGKEETVVKINKDSLKVCLNVVIDCETELRSLFEHYRKFLESVDILYYPKDDKKDDKSPTGSDGGSGTDEEEIKKAFGKIKEQKPYSPYSSRDAVAGELKDRTTFVVMEKSTKPCKYSLEIIKQANALVNLLDISFQPKEDKVENLKCGKMSPHKIAEIPAGNTHIYHRVEEDQSTRPFSICVLGDESGSMTGRRGGMHIRQNELMKMLYYAFSQILPQDKMFFFGHSGNPEDHGDPEIRVYHDKYNQNFESTIERQLNNDYNENYDGPVVECIYERVREQTSDNIIFISISDGSPSGHNYGGPSAEQELKRVIEKCKRDGFVTVGVGLQYGRIKDIYNYHTIVMNMDKLVKSVSSLINQVVKTEFKD